MPKTSHELAIEFAVEITEVCLALPLRLLSQNLPQKSNFGRNGEERINENEKAFTEAAEEQQFEESFEMFNRGRFLNRR